MEKLKKQTNQKIAEFTKEITEDVHETVEHFIEGISKNIKKIEWAPVKIPPRRRIQTLAAGVYVYIFMVLPFLAMILTGLILVSKIRQITLIV